MAGETYLFAAFALIWAAVFGYLLFLDRKRRALEERLRRLEESQAKENIP